ncbi:13382_t:CDS:1, partial [Gigaspora margarita]
MDLYYIRRLLVVVHNNLDSFIALHFRHSEWSIGTKEDIEIVNQSAMVFRHRSSKNKDIWYLVNIRLGTCECSLMGMPCKHQASIAKHFYVYGINQVPTMSA